MQFWLVVWNPLKNISQLGWLSPMCGKIKNVPNHQSEFQNECHAISWTYMDTEHRWEQTENITRTMLLHSMIFGYVWCAWQSRKHKHIMSYPPRYFLECTPNPWCLWETSDPFQASATLLDKSSNLDLVALLLGQGGLAHSQVALQLEYNILFWLWWATK